ncbi:double-stranded RNA-specific editase 1-like [Oratosquilla oratoria]|uniref:double-stranded RNA-specific editase 1-like n=1 Tax=Oratosquilla oratoria TaxID=337810 RepID=UPI003F7782E2
MGVFNKEEDSADVEMTEVEGGDDEGKTKKRKPWERPGGTRMKRKKVPGAKNIKIRRYVKPKNAVMCLNELVPGLSYAVEQEGGVQNPFCVSVEIEGQKYRGYGSSKQLAKQAAAEAALVSFVKPPAAAGSKAEDKTPWATLASFAIFKLFSEWREGRIGMCGTPTQGLSGLPAGIQPLLGQALSALTKVQGSGDKANLASFSKAISAHLDEKGSAAVVAAAASTSEPAKAPQADGPKVPKPAKQVPDNAAEMHPVTVLHQMNPGFTYTTKKTTRDNKPYFTVSADINNETYTGEGTNAKKAKLALAKEAIKWLYGVESTFEVPT